MRTKQEKGMKMTEPEMATVAHIFGDLSDYALGIFERSATGEIRELAQNELLMRRLRKSHAQEVSNF